MTAGLGHGDSRRLRVLAMVPSRFDTSPGQRFRIEQWAPDLAEHGIDITYAPFENDALNAVLYAPGQLGRKAALVAGRTWRRYTSVANLGTYDLVYIFRESALLGPAAVEHLLSLFGKPFVFDFDDAVFVKYVSPSNGYLSYLKFPGKTRTDCRLAAHVMAGNEYLATYAREVTDRITIVPTTIDTSKYAPPVPDRTGEVPVVGWSGSYSTAQYLDVVATALRRVAATDPFRLLVIGAPDYRLDGLDVEARPWVAATEVADLRRIDIGIMPLREDPWARGKCALKALQYMALGIPTVCSPVGANAAVIDHDRNGLLASTEDEWVGVLQRLIRSGDDRRRLGGAGRETVLARYSRDVHAPVVANIFWEASGLSSQQPERHPSHPKGSTS